MTMTAPARAIGAPTAGMQFEALGVPADVGAALVERGIEAPSPVQTLTVADGCAGRDLTGRAPTGSGKTIAFGIPLVTRTSKAEPRCPTGLVLVPTRELAKQVCEELTWLGASRRVRVAAVYGGVGFAPQVKALHKGVDVLVACPGRLQDLIERGNVDLSAVEIVVLDEADRMTDMGFLPTVRELLDQTPHTRQTLLFSATLDRAVETVVQRYQRRPIRHVVPDVEGVSSKARYFWWRVAREERIQLCADVVRLAGSSIVFCRTKHGSDAVARKLGRLGVRVQVIHGNRSQSQREHALAAFAQGRVDTLIATDVVARGIHVDDVACVVNFDLPHNEKDFLHRAGRTARAGAGGVVVTLVGHDHERTATRLQRALGHRADVQSPTRAELASLVTTASAREQDAPPEARPEDRPTPGEIDDGPSRRGDTRGTIRWYDARRGFGFIERPGDEDIFVHSSAIHAAENRPIAEGQAVRYRVGLGRRGPEAQRVELVPS